MYFLMTKEKIIMISLVTLLFKVVVDKVVLVTLIFPHLFQIFLRMFSVTLDLVDQPNLEEEEEIIEEMI